MPPELSGSAFLTTDPRVAGLSQRRLLGPDLERPYRAVRSAGVDRGDVEGRCEVYAARIPTSEFFSHVTAAQLYRMPLPWRLECDETVHISTFRSVCRPRVVGVVGHRLSAASVSVRMFRGFPLADPVSVWCRLAPLLSIDDLIAVGDFIVSGRVTDDGREPPLASLEELWEGARRYSGGRGARRVAVAIPYVRTKVDSRPESRLRMLFIRSGLPEPLINDETFDARGVSLGHPDLKYDWARTVFEYEGDGHRDQQRFRRDIARRERFEAAEWRVIRVVKEDVFDFPAAFIARTREVLDRRATALASGQLLP